MSETPSIRIAAALLAAEANRATLDPDQKPSSAYPAMGITEQMMVYYSWFVSKLEERDEQRNADEARRRSKA